MKTHRRDFLRSTLAATAALACPPALRPAFAAEPGRLLAAFQMYPPTLRFLTALLANMRTSYQPDLGASPVMLPGGSGSLAIDAITKATPDGSTVLVLPSSLVTLVPLFLKSNNSPFTSLVPVAGLGELQLAFAVGPAVPAEVRTMADYFQWLKMHPMANSYGVLALGSPSHFIGSELSRLADAPLRVAGYKGNLALVKDIAGGGMPAGITLLASQGELAQYPGLRLLALTGAVRSPLYPDLPTLKESGFAVDTPAETLGFFVRTGTPAQKVQELQAAVQAALLVPEVMKAMAENGLRPMSASGNDYATLVARERAAWTSLVALENFAA